MKRYVRFLLIVVLLSLASHSGAQDKDTVRMGIYITSIHDIDFKQKEFTVNFRI